MTYGVPKWLNNVALISHDMANSVRMLRDDSNAERTFTPEEHAIFQRWIEQAEQMSKEADAILKDWTALPGEES